MGRLRSALNSWALETTHEDKVLQESSTASGVKLISEVLVREQVILKGKLRTVTLRPRGGVPALEAELYDGSAAITLIWLGRRQIIGIDPGRKIQVTGRVGWYGNQKIIFNPRYELRVEK